jgi:hypothetical protein
MVLFDVPFLSASVGLVQSRDVCELFFEWGSGDSPMRPSAYQIPESLRSF